MESTESMSWEDFKQFLKGKVFLIGLTFVDGDEKLIEYYQTSGTVEELTDDSIIIFKRADDDLFRLPLNREAIRKAPNGEYTEKSTGHIFTNPDYLTTWTITIKQADKLDEIKKNGYWPAR